MKANEVSIRDILNFQIECSDAPKPMGSTWVLLAGERIYQWQRTACFPWSVV